MSDIRRQIIQERLDAKQPTDLPDFPFAVGENITQRKNSLYGGGRETMTNETKTLRVKRTSGHNYMAYTAENDELFASELHINGEPMDIRTARMSVDLPYHEVAVRNDVIEVTINE